MINYLLQKIKQNWMKLSLFKISVADSTEHSINSQALFEFILDIDEESEKDADRILKDLKVLLPWW